MHTFEWRWLAFLLPSILLNAFDAYGWRSLLLLRGQRAPSAMLFINHVASEAISRSIPLGVPIADSVRSLLLKKEAAIPLSESVITSLLRRLSLGITQCVFVLLAIVVGYSDIGKLLSTFFVDASFTNPFIVGLVTVCLIVALGITIFHLKKDVVTLAPGLVQRFRFISRFTTRLQSLRLTILGAATMQVSQVPVTFALYFSIWMMEFLETYMILLALGFDATVQQALAIEAGVSLLRLAAFFLPSGIGVQETGYAGIIATLRLGTTSSIGLFLVIKRVRDILWIALGYAILIRKGVLPSRRNIRLELTKV